MSAEYQQVFTADEGAETYSAADLERLDVDAAQIVSRYPQKRSALLPLLHLVQSEEGFVSQRGVEFCARTLDLTTAEVAGVATFYTQYKRHPNGTYTVGVCTNTLCAIMGGDQIFEALSEHLDVGHDETTEDGAITLERVECNAACDFAPVVMVNWEFFDNQTPASARELTDQLRSGADVRPTRGPSKVCTFKQVSRTLAGFSDGLADEGVGAAGPSLEGLKLAREKGWQAPSGGNGTAPAPVEKVAAKSTKKKQAPSANDAEVKPPSGDAGSEGAAHEKEV
ncbi:NADH-quinone oxidoreductase subunit NuoE [Angustibacter luteus]|uniref:NADH-quinone oxidoreductase subunit NuoE n=1 Tax=Angustibacter luteus TaxID=658456 RepID=A0ABW1JGI0_9ACTN